MHNKIDESGNDSQSNEINVFPPKGNTLSAICSKKMAEFYISISTHTPSSPKKYNMISCFIIGFKKHREYLIFTLPEKNHHVVIQGLTVKTLSENMKKEVCHEM